MASVSKPETGLSKSSQLLELFAVLSSVIFFYLSFPGGSYPYLAWIAMVPLGLVLHNKSFIQAFKLTATTALFGWLCATWWLVPGVSSITGGSLLYSQLFQIILCLFYAIPYGIAGGLYAHLKWTNSISGAFKGALVWTSIICLTPHILPGNIAHSQYLNTEVIQSVEIAGVPFLVFILHLISWLIVSSFIQFKSNSSKSKFKAIYPLLFALIVFITNFQYGQFRIQQINETLNAKETIQIGWIQPNIGINKRERNDWLLERDRIDVMTLELIKQAPDIELIIWPEIPPPLSYETWEDDRELINQLQTKTNATFLITGFYQKPNQEHYFNRVELIKQRSIIGRYDKQRLLPFGEFLPWEDRFSFMREFFPNALHYKAGEKVKVFSLKTLTNKNHLQTIRIFPLICYEAVFTDMVKEGVEHGAQILINPTDDAWFGNTAGSQVHLSLSLFRSVEFRLPLIRAANSGISAAITSTGQIIHGTKLPIDTDGIAYANITSGSGRTFYRYVGHWFVWVCAFLSVILILKTRIRNEKHLLCRNK